MAAPATRVLARTAGELGWLAPRPAYSALGSERGCCMPGLDDALSRYVVESGAAGVAAPGHG